MQNTFQPARLAAAKAIRGFTGKNIAAAASISDEWFSGILRGHRTPQPETVAAIARALDFPDAFFYRSLNEEVPTDAFHFRASSKLAKKDEDAARSLALIAMELCSWMADTYNLPEAAVPEIQELFDGEIAADAETAAETLRMTWGLGFKPIPNMLQLLEAKGVRVFSAGGPIDNVDAFSFRTGITPVVFLNVHKSAERLRFDLAHELGHLLLHSGSLYSDSSREKEKEANDFASAFLMPRNDVLANAPANASLERVIALKSRWGVSAMALAYRLNRLGVMTEWIYHTVCRQLSSRGFRSSEPISSLQPETSSLLSQLLADLKSRGLGHLEIARALDIRAQDVRDLTYGLTVTAGAVEGEPSSRRPGALRAV